MESSVQNQDHILVCLSPAPSNAKIIRTAYKMARAFNSRFTALFVETSDFPGMGDEDRERLRQNIKLAEELGASIETVYGDDVSYQISCFARISGVTKIVLGRSAARRHRPFGKPPLTERLIEFSPNMDIYIIPDYMSVSYREKVHIHPGHISAKDIILSALVLLLSTLIALLFARFGYREANIITVYILGVLIISVLTNSRLCGIVASVLSVLIFNFFFTHPRYSLLAYDKSYPLTFAVMLISALITGGLAARLKEHAAKAAESAYRTGLLFDTNQLLQQARDQRQIIDAAAGQLVKIVKRDVIFYQVQHGRLAGAFLYGKNGQPSEKPGEIEEAAEYCLENKRRAGAGTEFLPASKYMYYPVSTKKRVLAVAAVDAQKGSLETFEESILLAVLGECALAMENERNARAKKENEILAENERLRANLLRSISHDLRTPLTSISGNASNLISNSDSFDEETREQIYEDIYDDSMWLINLVENLLAVTRIEDGRMEIKRSTEVLEDVINEAMRHIDRKSAAHDVRLKLPEEILLVRADARLLMQVIINLVDNAVKYTPEGSVIEVSAYREDTNAVICIGDNGRGIPDDEKGEIFNMFFTGKNKPADGRRSMGLGLALCKSIIDAHGGKITVEDNVPCGTVFKILLPAGEVELHE